MTLYQLLAKVNFFAGKDKRGKTFKITEFNDLLPTVQDKLYNDELAVLVAGDVQNIPPYRLSITPLRPFISSSIISMNSGIGSLPSNYRRFVNLTANYREVDVITQSEFNSKRTSPFRRPSVNPFCYIVRLSVVMLPQDIPVIECNYFRDPTTPYYDYCQDSATLNDIYMPVGSRVYLNDSNVPCLYDNTGVLLASAVEKEGTYPIVSQTVELEWETIYHDKFVMSLLSAVGVNLDKADLAQYAEAKQ